MKKTIWVPVLGAIGLATAGAASAQQEVGRVISSTPVVQQVPVSRQVCNQQPMVQHQPQGSGGGAILGAIVGGVLGNQIGSGFGRAAATGVGAIAGAAVGDNLERRTDPYAHQAQCQAQTTYENRTVGYNVQYEYGGKTHTVQLPYDPGPTIALNIQPVNTQAPQAPQAAMPSDGVYAAGYAQPLVAPQGPTVVYPGYGYAAPAYPVYYARPYYRPYYVPPVSLSLGYVYRGGHRHHWHR